MANKQRHQPQQSASSRTTLVVLAAGGLAVAALVVWALTRTVESPAPSVADTATSSNPGFTGVTPLTATQTSTPTSSAQPAEDPHASVPRIAVEDLREKMKTNSVTIVDVRPDDAYATSHIEGALSIPFARVEGEMSLLPKNKPIVSYCT